MGSINKSETKANINVNININISLKEIDEEFIDEFIFKLQEINSKLTSAATPMKISQTEGESAAEERRRNDERARIVKYSF